VVLDMEACWLATINSMVRVGLEPRRGDRGGEQV
jgi:hypothetical protein